MSSDRTAGELAVLAGLPGINPRRLRVLLDHHEPAEALARLLTGRPLHPMVERSLGGASGEMRGEVGRAAAFRSVDEAADWCARLGVGAMVRADPGFPPQLQVDPDPPAVLFWQGDLSVLDARRVGIIGTRNATAAGRATAFELGHELAVSGVTVVSGLARGIDGAAHRGVRSGAGHPVGVVANGHDVPYPKPHAELWGWVGTHGLLLSEWPPGTTPEPWRFPLRNRILAALCEVLVVVESRERGGSLITARAAADRDVEVMAVPGSPRNRACTGTNALLVDGAAPCTSVDDVLAALGLDHRRQCALPFDPRPEPDQVEQQVLAVCGEAPSTLDTIVSTLGIDVAVAAMAVARLEHWGRLVEAGGWFEPAGSRLERS